MSLRLGLGLAAGLPRERISGVDVGGLSPALWCVADPANVTIGATGTITADLAAWTALGATAAPEDDYWVLTPAATTGVHYVRGAFGGAATSGMLCLTIDAKAAGADWISIGWGSATYSYFDLANGVTGTASSNAELVSIQPLGDGWFRCTMSANTTTANTPRLYVASGNGGISFTAVGTETALVRPAPSFGLAGSDIVVQQRVSEWTGTGGVLVQATTAAMPVYCLDTRGFALQFRAAHWMACDALAAAASGVNAPRWLAMAADDIGASYQAWASYGASAGADPSHALATSNAPSRGVAATRSSDDATAANGPTSGVAGYTAAALVDTFDGASRILACNSQSHSAEVPLAGAQSLDQFTIGALRGATASLLLTARVRELAVGSGWLSRAQARALAATLQRRYGYA